MSIEVSYVVNRIRNSYWFTPALMMVGAALLAYATINLDDVTDFENAPVIGPVLYSGGPDGARAVLSSIAGSMITVAGVVFSITIVTLQLASSQFGPRMLENFMRDRGNQITLGTFIATFLYSLLVLRVIRSTDVDLVPHLSTTVALLLAVAALSVLVYFIHHIATTIQAPNLVAAIARELHEGMGRLFPDVDRVPNALGTDEVAELDRLPELPDDFEEHGRLINAKSSGYVQVVTLRALVDVAREHDLVIRLETRAGRFLVGSTPFARAYPADRVSDEVAAKIAGALTTGPRRTSIQDLEFPIKQLGEIAVRALSPGINDPFTAATCVDQLGAGLCELAGRNLPGAHVIDRDGDLRVLIGDPISFDRLVGTAFDQIRQSAEYHVQVYAHMLEALTRVLGAVNSPDRIAPLLREARLVVEAAERNVPAAEDRESLAERHRELLSVAGEVRPV